MLEVNLISNNNTYFLCSHIVNVLRTKKQPNFCLGFCIFLYFYYYYLEHIKKLVKLLKTALWSISCPQLSKYFWAQPTVQSPGEAQHLGVLSGDAKLKEILIGFVFSLFLMFCFYFIGLIYFLVLVFFCVDLLARKISRTSSSGSVSHIFIISSVVGLSNCYWMLSSK